MLNYLKEIKFSNQIKLLVLSALATILLIVLANSFASGFIFITGSIIFLLAINTLFGLLIIKNFNNQWKDVLYKLEDLSKGKISGQTSESIKGSNELSEFSKLLNIVSANLKSSLNFIVGLGTGENNLNFSSPGPEDELGNSLAGLQNRWLALKDEEQKRNWANEALAKFNETLRESENIGNLSNFIIKFLVENLNANQGAIFLLEDEQGEENQVLEMKACYAFKRTKYLTKKILVGEGLLGQAFLEGEATLIKDVPDDFVIISSGMGDAKPKNILIQPIKKNQDVVGVIELASFRDFEKHELDFINKVVESIAHTVIAFRINENTKKLLDESLKQASQLQAQEEELRQNQEEMQATQEEISRKYNELFHELNELNYQSKFEQLKSINATKKRNIEFYFEIIRNQILTFSENTMAVSALQEFRTAFYEINSDNNEELVQKSAENVKNYYAGEFLPRLDEDTGTTTSLETFLPQNPRALLLQDLYIASSPHPTGEKSLLDDPNDGSNYSKAHKKYHSLFKNFLEKFGYYDIFLIDAKTGDMLYSVFKEVDFATNLLEGEYCHTNFGRVVKETIESGDSHSFVKLVDFEPYAPSYTAPASFIASPIFDNGEKIGVLVFQMPINKINQILTGDNNWANDGLGITGETFIVGDDYKLRSIRREIIENDAAYTSSLRRAGYSEDILNQIKKAKTSILLEEYNTGCVKRALGGESKTAMEENNVGVKTLTTFAPLNVKDVNWVILSVIQEEEAASVLNALRENSHLNKVEESAFVG